MKGPLNDRGTVYNENSVFSGEMNKWRYTRYPLLLPDFFCDSFREHVTMYPVSNPTRSCPPYSHQVHPVTTINPFLPLFHRFFPYNSGHRYVGNFSVKDEGLSFQYTKVCSFRQCPTMTMSTSTTTVPVNRILNFCTILTLTRLTSCPTHFCTILTLTRLTSCPTPFSFF